MGMFIQIEVAPEAARQPELARKLAEICPVDIFAQNESDQSTRIVEENVDECVLCDLCIQAAPDGAVRIVKLYAET